MRSKRNLSLFIVLVVFTLVLAACNDKSEGNTVKKASFDTQVQEEDFATFEIPANWEKKNDLSSNEILIYGPKETPKTGAYSSVNIAINVTGKKVSDIETVRAQFEANYEKEIKAEVPDAKDFKIISYKANIGDVLMVSYSTKKATIIQHYPLVDNAIIAISSTDVGEQDQLKMDEVTKHVVDTFQLKGNDSES